MFREFEAIRVRQTFADFFCISIKAIDLLQLCFSDTMRYNEDGTLAGSQRQLDEKGRLNDITDYINSKDLSFPNSIVICANYNKKGYIEEDENIRWSFEELQNGLYSLKIPTKDPLAAVIDGQHRLFAFKGASDEKIANTELLVSVFFDLPLAYQAYIFATINYNQKPVSKSLALEQFGYLLDTNNENTWSPELLAVFLSRKLNTDLDSSFYNHIKVAPQNDNFLLKIDQKELKWTVSMSTCVTGILSLISNNPKRDANFLNRYSLEIRRRTMLNELKDSSVLRSFYIDKNDFFVYKCILNFFNVADSLFFKKANNNSFITKTIGIAALFKILNSILEKNLNQDKDISIEYFRYKLDRAKNIDFTDNYFKSPSGSGINRIYNAIAIRIGLRMLDEIRNADDKGNMIRLSIDNLNDTPDPLS